MSDQPFDYNPSYQVAMQVQKNELDEPVYKFYPNALRVTSMPTQGLSMKCLAAFNNQEQSTNRQTFLVSAEDDRIKGGYGAIPSVCDMSVIKPGEKPRTISHEVCIPPGLHPLFCDGQQVRNATIVPSWAAIPQSEFQIDSGILDPRRCYAKPPSQL